MDVFLALNGLDACAGWLGALVFVIVGLVVVRRAHTGAGLMVAGAGALKVLVNCCVYWPHVYTEVAGYDEVLETVWPVSVGLGLLLRLAVYVLIAAAAFALVRRAPKGGQS